MNPPVAPVKRIALLLCGSGYLDGSEIRESVGALWALSRHPVEVECFAPDALQPAVMNHVTAQLQPGEPRGMLPESARIARGKIRPLSEFLGNQVDGLVIPGGFGVAKNLCTFALQGSQSTVLPEVQRCLEEMHRSRKPIGAICIAPALLALVFRNAGFELTVGARGEVSQEIEKLGHKHVVCRADQAHLDGRHKVVTTPAYMYDEAPLHEIFTGIERLVREVVAMS